MKIGDKIRVVQIPKDLVNDDELQTKDIFQRCLGQTFTIVGIQPLPERNSELLELEVGRVVGKPPYMHSIWIEPEFVELVRE